jgi:FdhD protein
MSEAVSTRRIDQLRTGIQQSVEDDVVVEEPLEVRLGDTAIAVVMRTPGDDDDLVHGFALTEGIALSPDEIDGVEDLGEGRYRLRLADGVTVDPERFRRNLYATSSCGVCGKASIDAVRVAARHPSPGPIISSETISDLPQTLSELQPAFDRTGGIHAAAAFTSTGEVVAVREDIGRHNAVDKLVGIIARVDWPVTAPILFVSGRVSFEIVQKAAVAGFPIVAGVSAVSSLAIDLADELGLTLLGFVRNGGFNTYTHQERITHSAPS